MNQIMIIVIIFLFIIIVVLERLKSEKEESRLTLRKNKLYTILSQKRKIGYQSEINDEIQNYYTIQESDFVIPPELKIIVSKFNQNVSNIYKHNNNIIINYIV